MSEAPSVLNVHTPTSSFAIVHSINEDSLQDLFDKLSRKSHTDYHGQRVGPGWLKYQSNDAIWNLDDDADYTIFVWRQKSATATSPSVEASASNGSVSGQAVTQTPTLHLRNPLTPLPTPPSYCNPAYYLFHPSTVRASSVKSGAVANGAHSVRSSKSRKTKASRRSVEDDGVPTYRKEFEKFHSENGVRTVMGSIGPVQNVRMLLKNGYRHVYISRKFAMKHAFIPADAAPGHYGYGGLVNIGTWPITLTPSSAFTSANPNDPPSQPQGKKNKKPKPTPVAVYLSEEPHFDVVLGRSFFEKRQIKTNPVDPTDVVCLDTGEKVECELVILKDGRGEIVTVT
ncbi:hypothetical protein PLICRDRAFT_139438 [Plicaturopsis crispa FD-325 SS-3]|nr:hypothetical protein PLICRDRAFT_139438 [Plicaturopsis crispa FD-325 SS-3]